QENHERRTGATRNVRLETRSSTCVGSRLPTGSPPEHPACFVGRGEIGISRRDADPVAEVSRGGASMEGAEESSGPVAASRYERDRGSGLEGPVRLDRPLEQLDGDLRDLERAELDSDGDLEALAGRDAGGFGRQRDRFDPHVRPGPADALLPRDEPFQSRPLVLLERPPARGPGAVALLDV